MEPVASLASARWTVSLGVATGAASGVSSRCRVSFSRVCSQPRSRTNAITRIAPLRLQKRTRW